MAAGITILNPGLLTTIQDAGRIGYQAYGVSASGVMDPRAMNVANILVGNDDNEAVLECTMMGPMLQFDEANVIAIGGGDLGASIDGKPVPPCSAVKVEAGQTLRFAGPKAGIRAYIAFAGGLDIPMIMGSRSTYIKAKVGGLEGRKLRAGTGFCAIRGACRGIAIIDVKLICHSHNLQNSNVAFTALGKRDT